MSENNGFRVTDKRAGARAASAPTPSSLILGQSVAQAKRTASTEATRALTAGRQGPIPTDATQARQMQTQRMGKVGSYVGGGGGGGLNVNFATQRPQDPFFYWQQNNLPYDFNDPRHLILLRHLCRHIYKAHSVMASAIDIYSKWPLIGLEFQCFSGDTRILTKQGTREIGSLSGEVATLVTTGGRWADAKVEHFGTQRLHRVTLKRHGRTKEVHATAGHRWFVVSGSRKAGRKKTEVRTSDLRPGQQLASTYPVNRLHSTTPSPFGVARGFTYGDGTLQVSGGGALAYFHGAKDEALKPYFSMCTFRDEGRRTTAVGLPAHFKSLPDIEEAYSYLYGWLAGYFAADGTVSKKGEVFLDSSDREAIEFVRDVCTRLGIGTYQPYEIHARKTLPNGRVIEDWQGSRLPIHAADLTEAFFLIPTHRDRWAERPVPTRSRSDWEIVSVEETDRVEDVYCAVVPDTEAFVLEDNILTGNCKDKALTEFYTDLFFDQLDYEEFLPSLLHEYWVVGEAFPLGSFNETLGVWEDDELLNPDDVFVEKSPFIKDPNLYIRLPESLRKILTTGQPPEQYHALMRSYPELRAYAQENARMPVSNVLLKHLKFKGDNFAERGLPIMYRALRPLMQEEMLNAAQDAIADRLYTPLILAKIGASATDLGTEEPWIPTTDQISNFEVALDAALAADFRVLTTHFAVDMQSVFGRETMPNFDQDFERLTEKQLQAFGLSKTMLSGAGSGETYAADALNRDLISQLLSSAQRYVKKFVRDRMLVVAEAQEHYDYEVRGGKRYPIMEEVLEVDEETGEQRIVEQPKLLVPDLNMKAMNLKDEQTERDFLEQLRASGVPISQKRRLVNIDLDLDSETEAVAEEQVEQAVEAQRVRRATYLRLKAEGLPIPQDLRDDFEARAQTGGGETAKTPAEQAEQAPSRPPMLGLDEQDTSALAPTEEVMATPPGEPLGTPAGPGGTISEDGSAQVIPLPSNRLVQRTRPPESDEMRAGMPTASLHLPEPPILKNAFHEDLYQPETDEDGNPMPYTAKAGGIVQGPRHIGLRRYAGVTRETVLGDEPGAAQEAEEG